MDRSDEYRRARTTAARRMLDLGLGFLAAN
jgi:hypothetical protein